MKINSQFRIGRSLPHFKKKVVKNEPMLFNCSASYALAHGGPITRAFVIEVFKSLPGGSADGMIVDTRVHMLMPGWYPCIPGYHHDDVPRSREDGQPNYENPEYRSKHICALVNGDICPTEFAVGEFEVSDVPLGGIIYKEWHKQVEEQLNGGVGLRMRVPSNTLIHFDDRSFHQGVPAVADGWRWFGRVSWDTHRRPTNEIRRQVQVYLEHPMEGW